MANNHIRATVLPPDKQIKVKSSSRLTRKFEEFTNIDTEELTNGSVLVYNSVSEDWKATLDLDKQDVDGGHY